MQKLLSCVNVCTVQSGAFLYTCTYNVHVHVIQYSTCADSTCNTCTCMFLELHVHSICTCKWLPGIHVHVFHMQTFEARGKW